MLVAVPSVHHTPPVPSGLAYNYCWSYSPHGGGGTHHRGTRVNRHNDLVFRMPEKVSNRSRWLGREMFTTPTECASAHPSKWKRAHIRYIFPLTVLVLKTVAGLDLGVRMSVLHFGSMMARRGSSR